MPYLFHEFVSPKADSADTSLVRPSNWNAKLKYGNHAGTGPSSTSATVRQVLTGNTTFYVSPTGSDVTGDGSQANPWQTIDFAQGFLGSNYDGGGFVITLQMADGTYASTYPLGVPNCSALNFRGNTSDQSKVIINTDGYSAIDFIGGLSFGFGCQYITFNMLGGCAAIENDGANLSWSLDNCSFTGSGTAYVHTYGFNNAVTMGFNQGAGPGMKCAGSTSQTAFQFISHCQFFTIGNWTIVGTPTVVAWVDVSDCFFLDQVQTYTNPTNLTLSSGFAFFGSNYSQLLSAFGALPGSTSIYPRGNLTSFARWFNGADPNDVRIGDARRLLPSNFTLYVRTDGNDNNTGVANNANGAFLTFAACFAAVAGLLDFGGHAVTISMQAGVTWTAPCVFNSPTVGGGRIILELNGGTISLTAGTNSCIDVTNCPTPIQAQNYTLTSTVGPGINGANYCNIVTAGTNTYGATLAGTGKIQVNGPGVLQVFDDSLTMSGNGNFALLSNSTGSYLGFFPTALVLTGTPAFSRGFAVSQELAVIEAFQTNTVTTGTATGPRYDATLNAVIQTFGSGANNFPGNAAGTTSTGGQYA